MSSALPHPAEATPALPSLSYWQQVRQRFRKRRPAMFALRVLAFLAVVALFADVIAYDKPYTCVYQGTRYYPILGDYLSKVGLYTWEPELVRADWQELPLESSIWPPVRHAPHRMDSDNRAVGPFSKQRVRNWKDWHYLGTNRQGRDVLAGLVHGTRYSLTIGIVAMGIASLIGIFLGSVAGYFGDHRLKISRIAQLLLPVGLVLGFFYGFIVRSLTLRDALALSVGGFLLQLVLSAGIVVAVVWLFRLLARPLEGIPFLGKRRDFAVDMLISRITEVVSSLPTLLLLVALLSMSGQKSIFLTMVLIGLMGWTGITQYMRLEMLRTRNQGFVQSAEALGFQNFRILFRHALPTSVSAIMIAIAFGIGHAIAIEAALSFLEIGVPDDTMTWGKLLNGARYDIRNWWLSVFPGLAIFLTITTMNLIGEGLRDAMDPKTEVN